MEFNAKVDTMNVGLDFQNANVILASGEKKNLKLTPEQAKMVEVGKTYHFTVEVILVNEKEQLKVLDVIKIFDYIKDPIALKEELKTFYEYAPVDIKDLKISVESYLEDIDNPILKTVTNEIYTHIKMHFICILQPLDFTMHTLVVLLTILKRCLILQNHSYRVIHT